MSQTYSLARFTVVGLIYEDPAGRKPADVVNAGASGTSGSGTDFFIRGGDIDGHFIAGNKPATVFFYSAKSRKKALNSPTC